MLVFNNHKRLNKVKEVQKNFSLVMAYLYYTKCTALASNLWKNISPEYYLD